MEVFMAGGSERLREGETPIISMGTICRRHDLPKGAWVPVSVSVVHGKVVNHNAPTLPNLLHFPFFLTVKGIVP
jgi:hypothetical protein